MSPEGEEVVTDAGADSIYRSLKEGRISLGDASLRGLAIPQDQRDRVVAKILNEVHDDAVRLGLTSQQAWFVAQRYFYGDNTDPNSVGLSDLVNSNLIPRSNTVKYNQLNVTYAKGPDGRYWATPFERATFLGAIGVPIPQQVEAPRNGTYLDTQGMVVDDVLGINTGLAALERIKEDGEFPKVTFDFKAAAKATKGATPDFRRQFYGRGGYSSGSYARWPYYAPMDDLPKSFAPDVITVPMINTSNPYVRRGRVERERVTSDRGRLNQWQ
jgi:hypothetical protein